jgi:hypothetical protein
MDLTKAQRLLIKIQAFLDNGNGNEISRLEKDLMKSYIIQLYDAVSGEEAAMHVEKPKQVEVPEAKSRKTEANPVHTMDPVRQETVSPFYHEPATPTVKEVPMEIKVTVPEPVMVAPKPEAKPIQVPVVETVIEVIQKPVYTPPLPEVSDAMVKLFELPGVDEVSERFSHIPITNIEAALGLNERIFTLKELFGGNRELFEATCAELNNLHSFTEATRLLMNGPARNFNWTDQERIKMAEHFIRIVSRRYPKS